MIVVFKIVPIFIATIWNGRNGLDQWKYFLSVFNLIWFTIFFRTVNAIIGRRRCLHNLWIIESLIFTFKEILRWFSLLTFLPALRQCMNRFLLLLIYLNLYQFGGSLVGVFKPWAFANKRDIVLPWKWRGLTEFR